MKTLLFLTILCATAAVMGTAGTTLPLPTSQQLAWQAGEIMALIHFNMATFFRNGDPGCGTDNWAQSKDPAMFAPTELDIDDWAASMKALGIEEAVLTAKHGCGFAIWNTNATLPDGRQYGYNVSPERDVARLFSEGMAKHGIGHGFYYSLTNNYFLNVCGMKAGGCGKLQPGQVNVTQAEFEDIALAQLSELWTQFGKLTEIWFDGGYEGSMKEKLLALLATHQPDVVGFNAGNLIPNAARWVGTEGSMGKDVGYTDVFSTYCCNSSTPGEPCVVAHSTPCSLNAGPYGGAGCGATGDDKCDSFYPAAVDFTLQAGDVWFFEPSAPLRSLSEMIEVYHNSVGRNTVLELDFAVDRRGKIDPAHAKLYKALGDWIFNCYSEPVASASADFRNQTGKTFSVAIDVGEKAVDRVMIREDQTQGQRILNYRVVSVKDGTVLSQGKSVGNKRIDMLVAGAAAAGAGWTGQLRLDVLQTAGDLPPVVSSFSAFSACAVPSGP